jgi:hypothetical protein
MNELIRKAIGKWLEKLRRTTPATIAVRSVSFAAAAAALWAGAPSLISSPRLVTPIIVIALLPALLPGSRAVTAVMLLTVAGWMFGTLGLGEEISVASAFGTACALYLLHSSAALAAVLPHDAIVDTAVLVRWAARAGLVLVASAAVTAIVVTLARTVTPTTSMLALLAGFGVVAGTVWLLARRA